MHWATVTTGISLAVHTCTCTRTVHADGCCHCFEAENKQMMRDCIIKPIYMAEKSSVFELVPPPPIKTLFSIHFC